MADADAGQALESAPDFRKTWVYVVPLAVYMAVGAVLPGPAGEGGIANFLNYPAGYALKIALTLATMAYFLPGYRLHPLKVHPLSWLWGVPGVVLWIALVRLGETVGVARVLAPLLGGAGERPAFDAWAMWAEGPVLGAAFLAVRFLGLAAVVPVIEEFFLRGFAVRIADHRDWESAPIGPVGRVGLAVAILLPVLMHPPHEALAAAAWFGLVTLWVARTRNLWDAVAVHVVTNFLLGVYVLSTGAWSLW